MPGEVCLLLVGLPFIYILKFSCGFALSLLMYILKNFVNTGGYNGNFIIHEVLLLY